MRVLGTSIQKAEEARKEIALILVKHGASYPVVLPDISTKEKAQKFIGLNMQELKEGKREFLNSTVIEWDKKAKERQGTLISY
jgi:nitrite reductase (cytochrome c-552)